MKPQSFQEVEKTLKTAGFRVVRSNGSHFVWKNDSSGKSVPVPHHAKLISVGTLLAIYRQAGLRGQTI